MSGRKKQRSEDSYVYHDILPSFEDYGYPARGDNQNLKIKGDIRIRIGSGYMFPDVVYYADGVPVLLVEAKKEGKSRRQAEDQARSYILNFPIQEYSRDGRPPQYAAVTVGRRIHFYRYERDTNEYGGIVDRLVDEPAILTYQELRRHYGLVERKQSVDTHSFKATFYALVSAFDIDDEREVNPEIILKTVKLLYEFLRNPQEYVTREPYTHLGQQPHIQRMVRSILGQYDWSVLTPVVAQQFREIVVRAFQGSKHLNQYITPWPVVKFMTDLVGVKSNDKVLDFECGSGGFIAAALDKSVTMADLKGVDIADLPYYISKLFLALHSNTHGGDIEDRIQVHHGNGLFFQGDNWDVVISNPAGGWKYDPHGVLRDISRVYENLERDLNADGKDDPASEYYFSVQQAVRSAKVGGKICLVLPEGYFSNSSDICLRKYVAQCCAVRAIIGLPRGVFQVGATTRTVESGKRSGSQKMSILYAEKMHEVVPGQTPSPTDRQLNYPVFLAAIEKPRNPRSQPRWLERALSQVLTAYRQWQAAHKL